MSIETEKREDMNEALVIWGSFFIAGAIFWIWELLTPARAVSYRAEFPRSLVAFLVVFCFFFLVAGTTNVLLPPTEIAKFGAYLGIDEYPTWLRAIVFFLAWDCAMYWVHRLMHTDKLWRVHRWHHAPTRVWWLVGVRGSLPHIVLTYLPFLLIWIFNLPAWVAIIASVCSVVGNIWMHVNINAGWMRWMEYLLVTPRFHAIHHSVEESHLLKNLGSLLTIWDRLFGTFIDPQRVDFEKLKFGISDEVGKLRLVLGV